MAQGQLCLGQVFEESGTMDQGLSHSRGVGPSPL